ncbi:energy-coupling factor transporter transmembrane protein EcfT [Metallumcola ferriviriculae]|uniref:Energy-coupling factor transporter transmembrane protein EcfT n=1 Tax=Metallumcola ferriviriculae TaxID=3039180 RepID=A0AAU0UJJ9_9FIRM|nr:energy-coupling factor transporter transmembrane protein EcfT [Desulfitibacteraceae bacterium MK1]
MLNDITIGQFVPGDSIVHRLDPRTKIIAIIPYILALFTIDNWQGYLFLTVVSMAIVLLSRLPVIYVLRGLKPMVLVIAITFPLHLFLTHGQPLFHLGPFTASQEGLVKGTFISLRLIYLVLITSLLTLTTSPIRLTDGLENILSPGKRFGLPAHELAMMMTIALRFIPTFLEETEKIMKAQKARGADFETGNLIRRGKNLVPLLVPLFISAFRRADDLALAMEARCYRGGVNRTKMVQLKFAARDGIAFLLVAVLLILSIASRNFA